MLASTVQFSTYDQTPITRPRQTHHRSSEQPHGADGGTRCRPALTRGALTRFPGRVRSLRTQQRAYDPAPPPTPDHTPPRGRRTGSRQQPAAELVSVPPSSTTPDACSPSRLTGHRGLGAALHHIHEECGEVLLRKEVIQPHLPVRLPCYDFVPIADPAFDGSLHKGWATGFGRYRLS